MKTELSAAVQISRVAAFAEVAVVQTRPELRHLCQAAEEGVLTQDAISRVVPGLTSAGQRHLQTHCRYLGLVDASGRLTPMGRACAQTGDVPVPEQGVYSIWVAAHEAFGRRVLHLQREETDARDNDPSDLVPISDLVPVGETVCESVVSRGERFVIRALRAARGEVPKGRIHDTPGEATVHWSLDLACGQNERRVSGHLRYVAKQTTVPFRFTLPPLAEEDVAALISRWDTRWDATRGLIAVAYDGSAKQGIERFRRTVSYPSATLPGQGTFSNVSVSDAPVGPGNAVEAQDWATHLHRDRILASRGYMTDLALRTLFEEVVSNTPLAPFAPSVPPLPALLRDVEALGTTEARLAWWRLATPDHLTWML